MYIEVSLSVDLKRKGSQKEKKKKGILILNDRFTDNDLHISEQKKKLFATPNVVLRCVCLLLKLVKSMSKSKKKVFHG